MQNTSELYKTILAGEHHKEVKLDVYTSDGITFVGSFGEDKLIDLTTTHNLFGESETFAVGVCASGEIKATFYPTDDNGDTVAIPKMARLLPFVRLVSHETDDVSEWVQKGVFFTDTRTVDGADGALTLTGYDALVKADADYPSDSQSDYPATDIEVVEKIATAIDVDIDSRTYDVITGEYEIGLPIAFSQREVLSAIATPYCANFCISDKGKLLAVRGTNMPMYVWGKYTYPKMGELSKVYISDIEYPRRISVTSWDSGYNPFYYDEPVFPRGHAIYWPNAPISDNGISDFFEGSAKGRWISKSGKYFVPDTFTWGRDSDGVWLMAQLGTDEAGEYIGQEADFNRKKYPQDGHVGEYWYTLNGTSFNADTVNLDETYTAATISPTLPQITKVVVQTESESGIEYVSGTDSGSTLTAKIPWGTQAMADDMLDRCAEFAPYKPYTADRAIFDPAAEIGDNIDIGNENSGIYSQRIAFNTLFASDISAPNNQDIEHEIPAISRRDREYSRRIDGAYSKISQTATEIRSEVAGKIDGEDAQSLIDQTLEGVTLSVSNEKGTTTFVLKSGNVTLDTKTVDLHVKSVNVDGDITANAINLNTASITGELTATNIDSTNLHVSGANIDNLTVTNAQIGTLDARKIVGSGLSGYIAANAISDSSRTLSEMYVGHLHIPAGGQYDGVIEMSGANYVIIGNAGVKLSASGSYTSWADIVSGATGGAVFG